MTFTNLEKYVYSKKCLKQRRQPPTSPSSKVEGQEPANFRAKNVTWPWLFLMV